MALLLIFSFGCQQRIAVLVSLQQLSQPGETLVQPSTNFQARSQYSPLARLSALFTPSPLRDLHTQQLWLTPP